MLENEFDVDSPLEVAPVATRALLESPSEVRGKIPHGVGEDPLKPAGLIRFDVYRQAVGILNTIRHINERTYRGGGAIPVTTA